MPIQNEARLAALGRSEPQSPPPQEAPPEAAPEAGGDELGGLMSEITAVLGQVAASLDPEKQALVSQAIELLQQVAGGGTPGVAQEPSLPTAAGAGTPPLGPV